MANKRHRRRKGAATTRNVQREEQYPLIDNNLKGIEKVMPGFCIEHFCENLLPQLLCAYANGLSYGQYQTTLREICTKNVFDELREYHFPILKESKENHWRLISSVDKGVTVMRGSGVLCIPKEGVNAKTFANLISNYRGNGNKGKNPTDNYVDLVGCLHLKCTFESVVCAVDKAMDGSKPIVTEKNTLTRILRFEHLLGRLYESGLLDSAPDAWTKTSIEKRNFYVTERYPAAHRWVFSEIPFGNSEIDSYDYYYNYKYPIFGKQIRKIFEIMDQYRYVASQV
eukprot:Nk52_evm18s228 gene=Nk52_evmTU18s228